MFLENGEFGQHLPNSVHLGDNLSVLMFSIVPFEVGYVLFVLIFLGTFALLKMVISSLYFNQMYDLFAQYWLW